MLKNPAEFVAELRSAMRGGTCRVLSSAQRSAASHGQRYADADVVVVAEDYSL